MNTKNNNGPKIEPWDTPNVTGKLVERIKASSAWLWREGAKS